MFDNEIDWVTRLKSRQSAVRRTRQRKFSNTYTYKAEHKHELGQVTDSGEMFKIMKSVFRRCGDLARER